MRAPSLNGFEHPLVKRGKTFFLSGCITKQNTNTMVLGFHKNLYKIDRIVFSFEPNWNQTFKFLILQKKGF